MSYIINKFNGEQLIVLEDGTIDTTTSINLVGRNYVGYGESQNENFLWLLENFANESPPSRPLVGQIWFNTTNNLSYVYDGNGWNPIGSATLSDTSPTSPNEGMLWLKTTDYTLYVWKGDAWNFVGPESAEGFGITRARTTTLSDLSGNLRPVIFLELDDQVIGICTNDTFTINPTDSVSGFSNNLVKGINLSTSSKVNGDITGNAYTAELLKTARNINGVPFDGGNNIIIKSSTTNKLKKGTYITGSDFDGSAEVTWSVDASSSNSIGKIVARNSEGGFSAGTITADLIGNITGNVTSTGVSTFNIVNASSFVGATLTGNAGSATRLLTARKINDVAFDGSRDITITAAASTLTGDILANNVTISNLEQVGTLSILNVADAGIKVGSSSQLKLLVESSTPTIRSATGTLNFDMGLSGPDVSFVDSTTSLTMGGPNAPAIIGDNTTNLGITGYKFNKVYANEFKGNADTATLAASSTNIVGGGAGALVYQTGIGITEMLGLGADGYILVARPSGPTWESLILEQLNKGSYINMINTTTSGDVSYFNASVPVTISVDATSANTANKIVVRDSSGNFSAGTITANLTGDVSGNVTGNVTGALTGNSSTTTKLRTARLINGLSFDGTADIEIPNAIKAWVKFRGANGTILKSSNVTSVVRTSSGRYTINISPGVFSNNQYAVAGSASDVDHIVSTSGSYVGGSSTTTQLLVSTVDISSNAVSDSTEVSVIMVGTPYEAGEASIVEANGQAQYTVPGTYSLTISVGVTYISVVAIGGGGGGGACGGSYGGSGGGGGACAYANDIPVTAGETLTVIVGAGGGSATAGGDTKILRGSTVIVQGGGGRAGGSSGADTSGGTYTHYTAGIDGSYGGWVGGIGGKSNGGTGNAGGNGTGSGYIGSAGGGSGGHTGGSTEEDGGDGAIGATGGGAGATNNTHSGAGGGGGPIGQGKAAAAGSNGNGSTGGNGGAYGGGGGGGSHSSSPGGTGGNGALRVIWGSFRAFPANITQDL